MLDCNSSGPSVQQTVAPRLDSSSFDSPANMNPDRSLMVIEYGAENLLRTREAGRLTADMQTWGGSQSIFMPLRVFNRSTTLALSHTDSNASLYYDDSTSGTDLSWASDSQQWAISHAAGRTRFGISGMTSSGSAPGRSLYPAELFNIFSGWTPVRFELSGRQSLVQVVRSVGGGSEVSMTVGQGRTSLDTWIGQGDAVLSVPASVENTAYGLGFRKPIGRFLRADVSLDASTSGGGATRIYKGASSIGKLNYDPGWNRFSACLLYQKRPDRAWEFGFVWSHWSFGLHGMSINGNALGLNLKPFSERVDFDAATILHTRMAYLGRSHRVSDKWSWRWRYKLARAKSMIDADYVGRAFLGLISASGSYDNTLLASRLHSLEMSARYANKRTAFEMRLDQAIPQNSGTENGSVRHDSKSVGGTSFSIVSSYTL